MHKLFKPRHQVLLKARNAANPEAHNLSDVLNRRYAFPTSQKL